MSKSKTEKMLDMLEAFHRQWQGADTEPEKWDLYNAFFVLILNMEDWIIRAKRALGDPDEKTLTRLLAEDIRDSGEEET